MVKSAPGVPPDRLLDLCPVAIAVLVRQAEEYNIALPREVLRLLGYCQDHLFDGALVCGHFLAN